MTKPRVKTDDEILAAAKTKLGKMITQSEKVEDVVSLCETLAKLKHVENESQSDGEWGAGLPGGGGDT